MRAEVCWFTAVNWDEAAVLAIFPGHLVAVVPDFGAERFAVRLQSRVVARLRGDHESWHQPVVCSPVRCALRRHVTVGLFGCRLWRCVASGGGIIAVSEASGGGYE